MRLIFATGNEHKLAEIIEILGDKYKDVVYSAKELGINIEPDETGKSYEENADIKAKVIYNELVKANKLQSNDYVISDDTGLSIDYLDGAPGINSARYMGKETDQKSKNMKILELLEGLDYKYRTAHFTTVLSVIKYDETRNSDDIEIIHFEGRVDGYIEKKIGKTGGFGYDPIFAVYISSDVANDKLMTYSELGVDGKNAISHRANALKKFMSYLEK